LSRIRQVLPHGVLLAAALLLYWVGSRIDVETGGRIGPGAWPRAVLAIMALLCVYEIGKRLFVRGADGAKGVLAGITEKPDDDPAPEVSEHPRKLAAGIALVAAYVVAAPWLGFFVSTALFLAIFPWIGGYRRPVLAASIALLGSLTLVVIFMRIAYVSLPLGAGPFKALSLALLRLLGVT
jgi:putative tricarboxylic transport membrane protein